MQTNLLQNLFLLLPFTYQLVENGNKMQLNP